MVLGSIWNTTASFFGLISNETPELPYFSSGCPSFAPENGSIFGCRDYKDCSPKYQKSEWFGEQAQYIADDFSTMMIIKAAELSRFAYKFREYPQHEIVFRSKSFVELIEVRLMYHKKYEDAENIPLHPPDKSLEMLYFNRDAICLGFLAHISHMYGTYTAHIWHSKLYHYGTSFA